MSATDLWFSKPLGDGVWAYGLTDEVRQAFEPLFDQAGRPPEMAVFTRHESEGRLQCEVVAYFSPAAAGVARLLQARPCGRPACDGLDLLAGDPGCWAALFAPTLENPVRSEHPDAGPAGSNPAAA